MKISVDYEIADETFEDVKMEVSDEFKYLTNIFVSPLEPEWNDMANKLEDLILKKLPKNAKIFTVVDAETYEIVYQN